MASKSRGRKPRGWLKWLGIIFLAIVVIGVINDLFGSKPKDLASESAPYEAQATAPSSFVDEAVVPESASGNKDWDIIVREGHPTYYGSVEASHQVWDDVENGKVIFGDSNDSYGDNSIVVMDAWRNSDLIRNVEVYLKNFEQPLVKSVGEILPTIASYMPFDIMDRYYEFSQSYKILPDDGDGTCCYVIRYRLNDAAHTDEASSDYTGTIDVIIETTMENSVESFFIRFGLPRWMFNLKLNGKHSEEWACNLYDYR